MSTTTKKPAKKKSSTAKPGGAEAVVPERVQAESSTSDAAVKAPTPRKAKAAQTEKRGALNAAAKVLTESGEPMPTSAMIEVMAKKGYWTSPNGQTPAATLYAVVTRVPKTS